MAQASVEAWGRLLNKARDTYSETDLALLPLEELRQVMRIGYRLNPVDAARCEVQWQVLQSTLPAARARGLDDSARRAVRDSVRAEHREDSLAREQLRAPPPHQQQPPSPPREPSFAASAYAAQTPLTKAGRAACALEADIRDSMVERFRQIREQHQADLVEEQRLVQTAEEQFALEAREELWQLRYEQELRAWEDEDERRRRTRRVMTSVVSPARAPSPPAGGGSPRRTPKKPRGPLHTTEFEVPTPGPGKPCMSSKPRLGTDANNIKASDPNSCTRLRHHVKPAGGLRVGTPRRWGETTSEAPPAKPCMKFIQDPLLRCGNPCDMAYPATPLRTHLKTRPDAASPCNPNEVSREATKGAAKKTFPEAKAEWMPNKPADSYARAIPASTSETTALRSKSHVYGRDYSDNPNDEGRAITIPRKAAAHASPAANCDPNPLRDDTPGFGKVMVKPTRGDKGVMHPWVGPADAAPTPHPAAPEAEGVMPWNNRTRAKAEGRLHLRGRGDAAEAPLSPSSSRRQAHRPTDGGVMPGSAGWRR